MSKKKTYVLMISRVFQAKHPRAGEKTYFKEKILRNCVGKKCITGSFDPFKINIVDFPDPKLHTIRSNYHLWFRRAEEINSGRAVLSLRQWSGKPYASKQVKFLQLEKIHVQKVVVNIYEVHIKPLPAMNIKGGKTLQLGIILVDGKEITNYREFYRNDGFASDDNSEFKNWFDSGVNQERALIHFTDFKY